MKKYPYGPIIENKNYDLILHLEDKFEKNNRRKQS